MDKIYAAIFKSVQVIAAFLDSVVNDSRLRLMGPHFEGDLYPEYDRLLKKAPIVRSFAMGGWLALGFDAVTDALKDSRLSSDLRNSPSISGVNRMLSGDGESTILDYSTLLNTDPPDHTRLRKLARTGFLHKYIQSLEPRIQALIDDCLNNVRGQAEFDLVETLARPLPANVIAEILGVEDTERDGFKLLTEVFLRNSMTFTFQAQRLAVTTYYQLVEFMDGVVQRKRSQPGNDLISSLIATEEDGEQLTAQEVTTTCILLMLAGYETTTRLIISMVFLLSRHSQMHLLREQPQLIPNAVEESLRFEAPVQFLIRVVMENMEFHGARMKKHQIVTICYAAANRDPAVNEHPHEFDIKREKINHVAFGYGVHLCLGAELARLEARLVMEMLLDRYRNLSVKSETPKWEPNYFVRGLEELIVNVS